MTLKTFLVVALALLAPVRSLALPPDPWNDQELSFRLHLGALEGNENHRLLHDASQRYAVGFSASSPIAWERRLEADLEIWVNGRGYPATTTPSGETTGTLTFQATSLTYGLRAHTPGAFRPYGVMTVGFQANHLEGRVAATSANVNEDTLVPAAQIGLGLEWVAGRDLFSLDWRRGFAKGDFGEFGAHGLDLGGSFIGIGLGHRW